MGLPSPLDGMLEQRSRFLKSVSEIELKNFLMEMRGLKLLILETAVESVEPMWKVHLKNLEAKVEQLAKKVANEEEALRSKSKGSDASLAEAKAGHAAAVAAVDEAKQEHERVKSELQNFRDKYLQPLGTEFTPKLPIDTACTVVELKQLQNLVPKGLKWDHTHQHNPTSDGTNFLLFCISGLRLGLIGPLSLRIFDFEKTMKKPKRKSATKGLGDRTVLYSKSSYDYNPSSDSRLKFFKITFVPVQKSGSRFVQFTKKDAFLLLRDPGAEEEWNTNWGRNKTVAEAKHVAKEQNRKTQWWRAFFSRGPMELMEKNGYGVSSFSTDGLSSFNVQLDFLIFSMFKVLRFISHFSIRGVKRSLMSRSSWSPNRGGSSTITRSGSLNQ